MVLPLIIGVLVSLAVQFLKVRFGTNNPATLAIVAVLSIAGAYVYTLLSVSGLWDSILPVLTTAGAFYTFVIARFEA